MKNIYENEKLSKYNWFNLGGSAKILFKLWVIKRNEIEDIIDDDEKLIEFLYKKFYKSE